VKVAEYNGATSIKGMLDEFGEKRELLILHCRVGFTGIAVGSAGCRPS
jgi:pyruvate/2-oxoglutarate/acetoin dehydrogenase E1 component